MHCLYFICERKFDARMRVRNPGNQLLVQHVHLSVQSIQSVCVSSSNLLVCPSARYALYLKKLQYFHMAS